MRGDTRVLPQPCSHTRACSNVHASPGLPGDYKPDIPHYDLQPLKTLRDGFEGVGEIAYIDLAKKDNVSCTDTSRSFQTSYRVPRVGEIDLCVVRNEILLNGKLISEAPNLNG